MCDFFLNPKSGGHTPSPARDVAAGAGRPLCRQIPPETPRTAQKPILEPRPKEKRASLGEPGGSTWGFAALAQGPENLGVQEAGTAFGGGHQTHRRGHLKATSREGLVKEVSD